MTTFSAFQEKVQHGMLHFDFLRESLPMWVKSSHSQSLETVKQAAKPSELRMALLTAENPN